MHDQRVLNDAFDRQKQRAIDSSIPTEKEALGRLIKDGHWSEKAEEDIQEKKNYIKNLHQTKKQYDLQSHKASVQKTIDEQNGELNVHSGLIRMRNEVNSQDDDLTIEKYHFILIFHF